MKKTMESVIEFAHKAAAEILDYKTEWGELPDNLEGLLGKVFDDHVVENGWGAGTKKVFLKKTLSMVGK